MKIKRPRMLLVCLCLFTMTFTANALAWNFIQAAATNDARENLLVPISPKARAITKVKPQPIVKCRPPVGFQLGAQALMNQSQESLLPTLKPRGWEFDAQAFFARTKGKAIYMNNAYGYAYNAMYQPEVDFNTAMGIPDHAVVGSFTAKYRFRPNWSLRYSILPTEIRGGGSGLNGYQFGTWNATTGQNLKSKWERLYQQIGLVYDPIRTPTSRVGIFAEYVRINERISVLQQGAGAGTGNAIFDNDLNMAMVGVELEKLLKVTRYSNTLSLECKAGVAFCDDAFGSDLSTGLKYSVPLNNGRSGFLKGGYRYLTYKKNYSDVKMIDTAMDGGFLEMGFIF